MQRPRKAYKAELLKFHTPDYVQFLADCTPDNKDDMKEEQYQVPGDSHMHAASFCGNSWKQLSWLMHAVLCMSRHDKHGLACRCAPLPPSSTGSSVHHARSFQALLMHASCSPC